MTIDGAMKAARLSITTHRFIRLLYHIVSLSLIGWGVAALVLVLYLRPVAIRDAQVVSIMPPGALPFCIRTPQDCHQAAPAAMPDDAFYELDRLNYAVNRAITPEMPTLTAEHSINYWQVLPDGGAGPCIDYALTKRHRLIAQGYPSGAFSIAVVHTDRSPAEIYHAVLVARLGAKLYVLDNLTNQVSPIADRDDLKWVSHSGFGDLWSWRAGAPQLPVWDAAQQSAAALGHDDRLRGSAY